MSQPWFQGFTFYQRWYIKLQIYMLQAAFVTDDLNHVLSLSLRQQPCLVAGSLLKELTMWLSSLWCWLVMKLREWFISRCLFKTDFCQNWDTPGLLRAEWWCKKVVLLLTFISLFKTYLNRYTVVVNVILKTLSNLCMPFFITEIS